MFGEHKKRLHMILQLVLRTKQTDIKTIKGYKYQEADFDHP